MNLISFTETTKKLGISKKTLYRVMARDETFPKKKNPFGQKSYFVREEIDQWLENAMSENAEGSSRVL